jgi:hypothetical protein
MRVVNGCDDIMPDPSPPAQITLNNYVEWLAAINAARSPFADKVFAWYGEQGNSQLPSQVDRDPDRLHVAVDRAIRDTDALEDEGEIEKGTTVGFDVYGLVDVPIDKALETTLFYCGKPIGQAQGETFPFDTVFGKSHCSIEEKWGRGNYLFKSEQTNGGVVQDLHDDYTIVVRGTATDGYAVFGSFWRPTVPPDDTTTTSHLSLVLLKTRPDGKTELRHCLRRTGQSYAFFGPRGRPLFGFNAGRIRTAEKAFTGSMVELHTTGTIRQKRP